MKTPGLPHVALAQASELERLREMVGWHKGARRHHAHSSPGQGLGPSRCMGFGRRDPAGCPLCTWGSWNQWLTFPTRMFQALWNRMEFLKSRVCLPCQDRFAGLWYGLSANGLEPQTASSSIKATERLFVQTVDFERHHNSSKKRKTSNAHT